MSKFRVKFSPDFLHQLAKNHPGTNFVSIAAVHDLEAEATRQWMKEEGVSHTTTVVDHWKHTAKKSDAANYELGRRLIEVYTNEGGVSGNGFIAMGKLAKQLVMEALAKKIGG
jgi:hypothetical protein